MSPILTAILAAALFGAATPASKVLLERLPPLQLAGLLYLGAALAMLPPVAVQRRVRPARGRIANACRLAGVVACGGLLAPVLLLAALEIAPAGTVALLLNLEIAATAALGALLFGDPLGRRGWTAVAGIAAAGALLSGGAWPGIVAALLAAAACLCWGLDNQLAASIDGMTPAYITLWKGGIAGSVNLLAGLAVSPVEAPAGDIGAALAVGAVCYGASIALYIRAAHQLGAVRAQAVFATAPFLGAALAYGALGETLGPRTIAAAVLLAGALVLLLAGKHSHPHQHLACDHLHSHGHDDGHHLHAHPGLPALTRHSHTHTHQPLDHDHPHWPDLHHRH